MVSSFTNFWANINEIVFALKNWKKEYFIYGTEEMGEKKCIEYVKEESRKTSN